MKGRFYECYIFETRKRKKKKKKNKKNEEKDTKIRRHCAGIGLTTYVKSTSVNSDLEVLWESFYPQILMLHEESIANLVESDNDLEFYTLD